MPRCARVRHATACRALSSGTTVSPNRVKTIYDTRWSCIFRPRNGISECEPQIGEAVASWRCTVAVSMAPLSSCYPRARAAGGICVVRSLARSLSLVDGTHAGGSLPMRDLVRLSLALRRRLRRCPCLLLCCPPPPAVVRSSVVRFGRSFARCCCCCFCFVAQGSVMYDSYLVDPASSHMLVSKIKPCMSKHKPLHGEAANGSLGHP